MRRALLLALAFTVAGCDEGQMAVQPKAKPYRAAAVFADGSSSQTPPSGTVAQGDLARDAALATRPALDMALLVRGRERFDIYCAPCHGTGGEGDGLVAQRGFPRPPSLHDARLRNVSDRYFVDTITRGYGVMYPLAARVSAPDRWAITAYIRALQLSRRVPVAALDDEGRRKVEGAP